MLNFAIPTSITLLFTQYGLLGLFINAILSSVIPIPTELTISALLASGQNQLNVFIGTNYRISNWRTSCILFGVHWKKIVSSNTQRSN